MATQITKINLKFRAATELSLYTRSKLLLINVAVVTRSRGEWSPAAGHEPPGGGVDPQGAVERGVHGVRAPAPRAAARPRASRRHARQGVRHVHTHTWTHAHAFAHAHVRTHTHMHARTHAHTHARTHAHTHTHIEADNSSSDFGARLSTALYNHGVTFIVIKH